MVRAQEPSSARAGDRAIVLADGSVEGFVGGQCAAGSVRTAALGALATGEGVLLRVLPERPRRTFPDAPGASIVVNPCLSGERWRSTSSRCCRRRLHLVGSSPTAEASPLARRSGSSSTGARAPAGRAVAAVVSSHGGDEPGRSGPRWTPGRLRRLVCSHTAAGAARRARPDRGRAAPGARPRGLASGPDGPEIALSTGRRSCASAGRLVRRPASDVARTSRSRRRRIPRDVDTWADYRALLEATR